jgi:tetratricopeptide (TPR) repeat protein
MWFAAKEDEAKRLHDEGLRCLDEGDVDGAIERGEKLLSVGWSGGFELVALGKRKKGDREGALRALLEAKEKAPGVWLLAQLRGNLLDELGRAEEAIAAYDEALAVPGVWAGSLRYNRAVAHASLGRWGEALADAEEALADSRGAPFALGAVQLGRHDDAVSLVEHVASVGEDAAQDLFDLRVGVLRRAGRDEAAVRAACVQAIERGAARMEVARALASFAPGAATPRTRYRVIARGPAPDGGGFFRPATVRAANEAEALDLVAALEPAAVRGALAFESIEPIATETGIAEILAVQGRIFFGSEDEA